MNAQVNSPILNTQIKAQTYPEKITEQQITEILSSAQEYADQNELGFSGSLSPQNAWHLFQNGTAILVDVRTNEERKFVGYVPESVHVAWATGTSFNRNPRFLKELENKVGKDKIILLLCRSGHRSALAATAAFNSGFEQVYNVLEGFEGDLNDHNQRNQNNGWRIHQLPWIQD